MSVITDGMGLNITVMSYCGKLDFGIVADRDQMPDLWRLMDWLDDELQELVAAGSPSPSGARAARLRAGGQLLGAPARAPARPSRTAAGGCRAGR